MNNAKFDNAIDISKVDTSELPTPKRSPRKRNTVATEAAADVLDMAVMSTMFDAVGDILGSLGEGLGDILSGIDF